MIRKARPKDLHCLAQLVLRLWPEHSLQELEDEMVRNLEREDAAYFLACEDSAVIGFAQCQLRRDYVEGTESSPVGYLEGIYVAEGHRRKGIARMLLSACEKWAADMGCGEFASDCELENTQSLLFHTRVGFQEANRIICFTKKLKESH